MFLENLRRRSEIGRTAFAVATTLFVGCGAFATAAARADDVAVCVGVNQYTGLRPGANLNGCVNDAHIFAAKLAEYGFRGVTVLADAEATKSNILAKIAALRDHLHGGDRVVIYFAGHGTLSSSGESVILPSDAQDASEDNDIQVKELYDAVKGLGGDDIKKTIVLDSCHSGGMVRGVGGLRSFKKRTPRFYVRTKMLNQAANGHQVSTASRDLRRWQESDTNGADDLTNVIHDNNNDATKSGICYFTAAQKNEVANETEVGGETHGLFTYYMVKALSGKGDVWKDISAAVSDKVGDATDNEQKPLLYPSSELDHVVFGGGGGVTPHPEPSNLETIYNLSNPDPSVVSLRRFPDTSPVAIASRNYFEIKVGQDGYLVLLGRDPKNELDVLYPKSPTAESMQVHAGDIIRVPTKKTAFMLPDTAGTDGLKAILFPSSTKAEAMLKPFEQDGQGGRGYKTLTVQSAKRAWHEEDTGGGGGGNDDSVGFYTSEITTLIVPADQAAGH